MAETIDKAVQTLLTGGVIIYPTETLYALGCLYTRREALARITELKKRPRQKPLPLIIGDISQLGLVTSYESRELSLLAERFWPGPLSVLVPTLPGLPREIQDARGLTSIRVTPHPTARDLCLKAGGPLAATSANVGGKPAAEGPADLNDNLAWAVDMVIAGPPHPGGGPPSTVVKIEGPGELSIVRPGKITPEELKRAGFKVY